MANYYHEARAQVRNYKKMSEDNRRRAERRAELANARVDLPVHLITIDGRSCPLHKNTEQYEDIERMAGMVAWNGDTENMIDRFDVRAMLDFYREYEPSRKEHKSEDEKELEERLAFESFRDLVKLVRKGMSDEAGLAYVEDEALDIRVEARSKASAAAGVPLSRETPALSVPAEHRNAGEGAFATAGFDYGTDPSAVDAEEEDEEDIGDAAEDDMIQAAEDDEDALNKVGEECGIHGFTAQLQRAVVQEEEEMEKTFKKRKRLSRRKMTERVRRMLGQGLNPFGKSQAWWKLQGSAAADAIRSSAQKKRTRGSPDYGGSRRDSERPAAARHARNEPEFLTEFTAHAAADDSSDEDDRRRAGAETGAGGADAVHEALPGRLDPAAAGGPVALPAAGSKMYGRREYTLADQEAHRLREAERERIKMNRATVAKPGTGKKETPQERLKRLMAAQFNSNVAKDTKKILDRKAQEERDRQARHTIERHAANMPRASASRAPYRRSVSPPRRTGSDSRSPSPETRHHRDSYSRRSRSRSPDRDGSSGSRRPASQLSQRRRRSGSPRSHSRSPSPGQRRSHERPRSYRDSYR